MQLKNIIFIVFLIWANSSLLFSQEAKLENSTPEKKKIEINSEPIKVDFLFNYYDQDGDHSPVTGGKGTEKETVIAPAITINIPFKKLNILDINVGLDNISSASTDRIDGTSSSASSNDTRVHGNAWYTRKFADSGQSIGFMGGFSKEFDVSSIQTGIRYGFQTEDKNQELTTTFQYFHDKWELIYPLELRPDLFDKTLRPLSGDTRTSYNFSTIFSSVFTKSLQGSIMVDITQQQGLLSTPFHRVYLDNGNTDIERLPDSRLKAALGLRLNYFINDYLTSRFFYRYYWDDFGITANSFEIELPIKINKQIQLSPFYRYYEQSAADYFSPYGESSANSEFHTSDYDLSQLHSQLFGLDFKFTTGLDSFLRAHSFDSFNVRFSHYNRSDGLSANSMSGGFSLSF